MAGMAKDAPAYVVTSVDHALRLALAMQTEGPLRVSAAATRLGVAPSTAHRLLQTLVYRDFAVQLPDRTYAAGPVLRLDGADDPQDGLREAVLPALQTLVAAVDETASLAVLRATRCVMIASVEGTQALRVGSRDGVTFPAETSAGGKALLAALSDDEVSARYGGAPPEGLLEELAAVRRLGCALNRDGTEPGVTALAASFPWGGVVPGAAFSVSLPSARFDERRLAVVRRALADATAAAAAHN